MADLFPHDIKVSAQYKADIIRFTEGLQKIRRDNAALAAAMVESAGARAVELVGYRRAGLMFIRMLQEIWLYQRIEKERRAAGKAQP